MAAVDVDELYGLPLDRFVPERTALARELRQGGRRDEAAEVAGLRRPSVAAWAVNQLVRTQRRGVEQLLEAGDALRAAQEDVLAGRGDGRSLRAAAERERAAVENLIGAGRGLLTSDGNELSATIIDRVADTLHAAALDDDAREQVRDGRLAHELRHIGLGPLAAGGGAGAGAGTKSPPASSPPRRTKPSAEEKRAQEEQRRAEEERAKALSEARAAEREARRRAERAARVARLAQEQRDRAAEAMSEAEADLEAAQEDLADAEDGLRAAQRAVGELGA
jgi:hypothetical protein